MKYGELQYNTEKNENLSSPFDTHNFINEFNQNVNSTFKGSNAIINNKQVNYVYREEQKTLTKTVIKGKFIF